MPRNIPESTREGGREAAEPLTSGISPEALAARNSSGNASTAASILQMRIRLNEFADILTQVCQDLKRDDLMVMLQRTRQRGFRSQR